MKALLLEGGDKVGKHTATVGVIKTLIASNYRVLYTDFPQYWFFGNIIKHVLKQQSLNISNTKREIEVRCALYAIDRLFSLINIIPYLNQDDVILVSDRGWVSNTLTISFGYCEKKISNSDVKNFMNTLSKWDEEFIEILKPLSLLLLTGKNGKNAIHKESQAQDDLYENDGPQKISTKLYKKYFHLKEIYTQNNGEWRNINEIVKDILYCAKIPYLDSNTSVSPTVESLLKSESLIFVSPQILFPILYGKEWNNVSKQYGNSLNEIIKMSWIGDKEKLKKLEQNIFNIMISYPPKEVYFKFPSIIVKGIKKHMSEYPEINNLIKEVAGLKFYNYFSLLLT